MTTNDCIFCKIANKEINAQLIIETDDYVSFKDVSPQAPAHALVIPKKHYATLSDMDNTELMGKLMQGAKETAEKLGVKDNFRLVVNNGKGAGQAVFHVHLHVLGGRAMQWPPG